MVKSKDIMAIIVFISLAVVPLVFFPVGTNDFFVWPKLLVLRLIGIVYLLWIFKNRKHLNRLISTDWINRLLFLYLVVLIISTIFSINVSQSIFGNPFRFEGLLTIAIYFILFLIARQQGFISKKNVYWMLFTGCIVALYGIMQRYGLEFFPRDMIRENWTYAFSTIGNPNFLGTYIVLLLPFAVHSYMIEKKKIGLLIYSILFYGLLSTMTRGTWIGAFFSVLIYFGMTLFFKDKFKIRLKELILFGLVSVICMIVFDLSHSGTFLQRLVTIPQEIEIVITGKDNIEQAGSNRIFIWRHVIELIKMRPLLGFGLENLHLAFNQYFREDVIRVYGVPMSIDRAHNEYLHIAVSSGLLALALYLSFILLVIRKGVSKLLELLYAVPLLAAIFGYLIQAFFNISVVSVAYIFWIFLGFLASSKVIKT
jgi:putative inorganic carbon (HCO3(-)) transporter